MAACKRSKKRRLNHSSFSYKEYFISAQCALIFFEDLQREKRAQNFYLSGGKCGGRMELLNFAAPEFKAIRISSRFLIPSSLQQSQLFSSLFPRAPFVRSLLPSHFLPLLWGIPSQQPTPIPKRYHRRAKKRKENDFHLSPLASRHVAKEKKAPPPLSSKKGFCSKLKRKVKTKLPGGGMRRKGTKSQRPCAALK